jgi:hypothetical protein
LRTSDRTIHGYRQRSLKKFFRLVRLLARTYRHPTLRAFIYLENCTVTLNFTNTAVKSAACGRHLCCLMNLVESQGAANPAKRRGMPCRDSMGDCAGYFGGRHGRTL